MSQLCGLSFLNKNQPLVIPARAATHDKPNRSAQLNMVELFNFSSIARFISRVVSVVSWVPACDGMNPRLTSLTGPTRRPAR